VVKFLSRYYLILLKLQISVTNRFAETYDEKLFTFVHFLPKPVGHFYYFNSQFKKNGALVLEFDAM